MHLQGLLLTLFCVCVLRYRQHTEERAFGAVDSGLDFNRMKTTVTQQLFGEGHLFSAREKWLINLIFHLQQL